MQRKAPHPHHEAEWSCKQHWSISARSINWFQLNVGPHPSELWTKALTSRTLLQYSWLLTGGRDVLIRSHSCDGTSWGMNRHEDAWTDSSGLCKLESPRACHLDRLSLSPPPSPCYAVRLIGGASASEHLRVNVSNSCEPCEQTLAKILWFSDVRQEHVYNDGKHVVQTNDQPEFHAGLCWGCLWRNSVMQIHALLFL